MSELTISASSSSTTDAISAAEMVSELGTSIQRRSPASSVDGMVEALTSLQRLEPEAVGGDIEA